MGAGRPFKEGIDYFPLDVNMDDKFEIIQAVHGLKGWAIALKLYQKIYANSYYLNVDDNLIILFSNRNNVDINLINDIIKDCVRYDIFDKKIWENYRVLTSRGIQKRYFKITERRKKFFLCEDILLIKPIFEDFQEIINVDIKSINSNINTQSKVEVKESRSKGNKSNILKKPDDVTEQTWKDFLKHRKEKKASVTETVIKGFRKQANLAGYTLEDAIKETIERGWQGFKAEWVKNKSKQKSTPAWL